MRRNFLLAQRLWSFAYHVSGIGAAVLAAAATVLVAVGAGKTVEAVIAGCATVLSTVTATGKFDAKWRSARLSRGRLEHILSDFNGRSPDHEAIRLAMLKVNEDHDAAVVGGVTSGAQKVD
jgi:hypothetical protein